MIMSAIVGIFHTDSTSVCPDGFDAMLAALAHRGPDGAGYADVDRALHGYVNTEIERQRSLLPRSHLPN